MRTICTLILILFSLMPLSHAEEARPPAAPMTVKDVKSIYLGEIVGNAVEVARFRMLLQQQLSKVGFSVSSTPESADAILSSVIDSDHVTVSNYYGNYSRGYGSLSGGSRSVIRGYSTAQLTNKKNDIIWSDDFSPHLVVPFTGFSSNDGIKNRAIDIAKRLAKLRIQS